MGYGRGGLTSRRGFENIIGSTGNYNNVFGFNLRSIFQPFTTLTQTSGWPHYVPGILNASGNNTGSSGIILASSSGYNQYGNYTLGEGIISGTGIYGDLDTNINPNNVRTFGIKSPINVVGPGFDIFGFPSPNQNFIYDASGAWSIPGATGSPSLLFLGSGTQTASLGAAGGSGNGVRYLNQVPYSFWKAGPLDIRWDQHRGLWTFSNGVQLARVLEVAVSGGLDTAGGAFSENIRYNAMVWDGVANNMLITGILHSGPRPRPSSYKVYPYSSGDYCFIINIESTGTNNVRQPRFGLWMVESFVATGCETTTGGGSDSVIDSPTQYYLGIPDGNPSDATGILTGYYYHNGLSGYPLSLVHGGIGFNSISSGQILIGHSGNNIGKSNILAGSGINLSFNYAPTGSITISLSTGVGFISAGVNTSITELQGLTTPLSISQGGTGASGKVWLDLTTDQNAAGTKSFVSGIRCYSGQSILPGFSFINDIKTGIFYGTGQSFGLSVSGVTQLRLSTSGNRFGSSLYIYDEDSTLNAGKPVLTIEQNLLSGSSSPTGDLIQLKNAGIVIGAFSNSGYVYSRFFHVRDTANTDVPIKITQSSTPSVQPFKIVDSNGLSKFEISSSCDQITLGAVTGSVPGYLKATSVSGKIAGYINLSSNSLYNGGYIDCSAGLTSGGGNIYTKGGGSINTTVGTIELGIAGARTTLQNIANTGLILNLPSGGTTLLSDAMVTGWHGTVKLAGSGNLTTVTLTVVNGIIKNMVEI